MKTVVGNIEGYDVIYVEERDALYCKNTAVPFLAIERIIRGNLDRGEIPEKKLIVTKDNGAVSLGCLTTTMENCLAIRRSVNKIKNNKQK